MKKGHVAMLVIGLLVVAAVGFGLWFFLGRTDGTVPLGDAAPSSYSQPDPTPVSELHDVATRVNGEGNMALPGMPDDYVLSTEQLQQKEEQAKNEVWIQLKAMQPGEDYVENEFIFNAEDEEEAALIAAAYGGVLDSFEYGVGKAHLDEVSELTLSDLLATSADTANNMPPIDLNTLYQMS